MELVGRPTQRPANLRGGTKRDRSSLVVFSICVLVGACAPQPASSTSDGGLGEYADASSSVSLAKEQQRGVYTDGSRCHAFGTCGSGRSNRELYCDRFIGCLEAGRGAAACEAECAGDSFCRDGLTYDSERNRAHVSLLQCLRANGGLGCFHNVCGAAPEASACPTQARWLRFGGGYASFRKPCN